ncbi:hypothetical protein AB0D34_23905 [Streptomyces sp. NPDC048420]|uniref:hypothetical protein n=1 Tax=Streptomyces sp. NPDC048420 TaxID=3155755 RepID=UPI0034176D5C
MTIRTRTLTRPTAPAAPPIPVRTGGMIRFRSLRAVGIALAAATAVLSTTAPTAQAQAEAP